MRHPMMTSAMCMAATSDFTHSIDTHLEHSLFATHYFPFARVIRWDLRNHLSTDRSAHGVGKARISGTGGAVSSMGSAMQ